MSLPTPPSLQVINGRSHKRTRAPLTPTALMPPPVFLGPEARREWRRAGAIQATIGVLTRLDMAIFTCYCSSWGLLVTSSTELALKVAAGESMIVSKGTGITRAHPLYAIVRQAQADVRRYATACGLTPSARNALGIDAAAVEHASPKRATVDEVEAERRRAIERRYFDD